MYRLPNCVSSLNISPEFQTLTLYHLLSISTWVSSRHLRLNSCKMKTPDHPPNFPTPSFLFKLMETLFSLVVLAKLWDSFLSHSTYDPSTDPRDTASIRIWPRLPPPLLLASSPSLLSELLQLPPQSSLCF